MPADKSTNRHRYRFYFRQQIHAPYSKQLILPEKTLLAYNSPTTPRVPGSNKERRLGTRQRVNIKRQRVTICMNEINYLSCDTQVEFGSQFFGTTRRNDGKTKRAIHWLPVPLAFNCREENGGEHNNKSCLTRFQHVITIILSHVCGSALTG